MKSLHSLFAAFGAVAALMLTGCQAAPVNETSKTEKTGERAAAIERAHLLFEKAVEEGQSREEAARRAARMLQSSPGVRQAEVTGSDTVLVTYENGEQLLVLLGRDRL